MKYAMRLTALVLTFCICFTLAIPAQAANKTTAKPSEQKASTVKKITSTDRANALNKLTILKGDNGNYNLDGQIKRSEAAAFIVRFMGKEAYVISNKGKYITTKFSDVGSDAWFAHYVGYCVEQGIIGGYPDGKFLPDETISEKAFLKLVLGAMGYKFGTDFTWNTIFSTAFKAGIVTDIEYAGDFDGDNTRYTREGVTKALYNALTQKNKKTQKTALDNLIAEGITTRAAAVSAGVAKDEPVSAITQAAAASSDTVTIKMNENIKKIDEKNISIYTASNKASKLTATLGSISADTITIKTSGQVADEEYALELANIEDTEGNIVSSLKSSFYGYRNPEVKADFFKVSKIEPVSKSIVNVYFTQPINTNAEMAMYYEILDAGGKSFVKGEFSTLSVRKLAGKANCASIYIKESNKHILTSSPYTLKISGELTSQYGCKLNGGSGESARFTGKGGDNEGLYVTGVSFMDNKTMVVEFNREVDPSSATQTGSAYYSIIGSDNVPKFATKAVMWADGEMKGKAVRLSLGNGSTFQKNLQYDITIKGIMDIYRVDSLSESKHRLPGDAAERSNLAIVSAYAVDRQTLAVYFDKPLNDQDARATLNYEVTSEGYSSRPETVYYNQSADPYMAKLSFASNKEFLESKTYTLKVNKFMKDDLGLTSTADTQFSFSGTGNTDLKPRLVEALIIGKDIVRVTFSKEISTGGSTLSSSNYKLEYKDGDTTKTLSCVSAGYVNGTTAIMRFDSMNLSKPYTLKVTGQITDFGGHNTRFASEDGTRTDLSLGVQ